MHVQHATYNQAPQTQGAIHPQNMRGNANTTEGTPAPQNKNTTTCSHDANTNDEITNTIMYEEPCVVAPHVLCLWFWRVGFCFLFHGSCSPCLFGVCACVFVYPPFCELPFHFGELIAFRVWGGCLFGAFPTFTVGSFGTSFLGRRVFRSTAYVRHVPLNRLECLAFGIWGSWCLWWKFDM